MSGSQIGSLAQLVQSICLTSRGSLVRTQYLPQIPELMFRDFLLPMYLVYILYSPSRNKYYVGSASEIAERLRRHNTNHSGFTGKALDWELKHTEEFTDKAAALKRERQIKSWKSRVKIEGLIKSLDN